MFVFNFLPYFPLSLCFLKFIYSLTRLLADLFIYSFHNLNLFGFQAGGHRRRPNLVLSFFLSILCCSIFCYGCMFALLCLFSFFSTEPRDWLGRTTAKWPILCRVGRETLTQSINQNNYAMKLRAASNPRCTSKKRW